MASDIKAKYGSNNQTITVTVASLTNTSKRESTAIDNSSNLYLDALVSVKIKSGGSGTTSTGVVNIFAYGTVNGGTDYTDGCTGSDAALTPTSPTNLKLIGILNVVANSTTYKGGPYSVASAFGGILPDHWGIVIDNECGGTLDSTAGNHSVLYQGVYAQAT